MAGELGMYDGDVGLYDGDMAPLGLGMYGLEGELGEPGCGDQAGLYPGLYPLSDWDGEKPAAPGVMPLPMPGDQAPM